MSTGITHFNKISGVTGVYVGANDAEVQIADSTGALYIGGVAITATAAELNAAAGTGVSSTELDLLDGALAGTAVVNKCLALGATKNVDTIVIADGGLYLGAGAGTAITATAAEINLIDGSIAGTAVASKALSLGATKNVDTLVIADGGLYLGAGAGTAVTATAAELNTVDASANTETIAAAGACSVTITNSKLALVGAGAVTLAAPGADMLGRIKQIEMTVDNGDVTLALTNVDGGSAATTCTWGDVGDSLLLIGGVSKWHVIAEVGVALT